MVAKFATTINNIERDVFNSKNKQLLVQFFEFMKKTGTSEKYKNNNLKAIIVYETKTKTIFILLKLTKLYHYSALILSIKISY
jgi:hypothetical protein